MSRANETVANIGGPGTGGVGGVDSRHRSFLASTPWRENAAADASQRAPARDGPFRRWSSVANGGLHGGLEGGAGRGYQRGPDRGSLEGRGVFPAIQRVVAQADHNPGSCSGFPRRTSPSVSRNTPKCSRGPSAGARCSTPATRRSGSGSWEARSTPRSTVSIDTCPGIATRRPSSSCPSRRRTEEPVALTYQELFFNRVNEFAACSRTSRNSRRAIA